MDVKYQLKFSSMNRYLKSVKASAVKNKIEWERESGDLWKYNYKSVEGAYWTGYFSTYPDFKRTATQFSDFAQAAQLINSLSSENN